MKKLLIVGAGMATARLLKKLTVDICNYDIEVIGEESVPSYNRILLSSLLSGEKSQADLSLIEDGWYRSKNIKLSIGEKVVGVDTDCRHVITDQSRLIEYDRLVLATGSTPFYPPIPGIHSSNVFGFRNQSDLSAIRKAAMSSRHAVVIGGGLLGLEAASGLVKLGVRVTVVNRESWLMQRQLDVFAADILQRSLTQSGLSFRLGCSPVEICEQNNIAQQVLLDNGETLHCDMVLVTAGIVPNKAVAIEAGIPCNRGILVNDRLETEIENVFALGECCELDGGLFGLVTPVYQQAEVLAAVLNGKADLRFVYKESATHLKISGVNVVSAGVLPFPEGHESQTVTDRCNGIYRRLVFDGSLLAGFILIGSKKHAGWYTQLLANQVDVTTMRSWIMFGESDPAPHIRAA